MTVQNKPFILSRRKDSPFYYARFKNEKTGKYLNAISTQKTDINEAEKICWKWYSEGRIERPGKNQTLEAKSISEEVRKSDLTDDDILNLIDIATKRGIIKNRIADDTEI